MLNRRHIRIKVMQILYAFFNSESNDLIKCEAELEKSINHSQALYIHLLLLLVNLKSLAEQKIEKGRKKILVHGNLNSTRTIIDTEDAMSAYWLVAKKGKIGDIYNIGGNKKISVGNFLRKLIKKSSKKIVLLKSKKLIRPKDVTLQIPSIQKFYRDTKWRPKVSFVSDKSFDYAEKIEKLIQKNK